MWTFVLRRMLSKVSECFAIERVFEDVDGVTIVGVLKQKLARRYVGDIIEGL